VTVDVRLRSEAEQDLSESARWYEDQRPGLLVDDDGAVVIGVIHGSRHPRRWKNRL
jgi:hypothetical protein